MDWNIQDQASPSSVIVTSRDKRRIGLKPNQIKGTPLFVPGSMKSAPINQYAGLWMRDSKGKGKQDYKFIERVLQFKEAQVSYFCKFFKLEQEGITQVIRFVSCIKDDELAAKVNALINYIKSWPDPNQVPRPAHPRQQSSMFGIKNERNSPEKTQSKKNSFFKSSTTSPEDSFQLNSSTQSSPNSYSQSSTPICSQSRNQTPFFRSSPQDPRQSTSNTVVINNLYNSITSDIRYSEIKEISRIPIKDPTVVHFIFPTNSQHFFLSLLGNSAPSRSMIGSRTRWPTDLQIWINEKLIKPLGTDLNNIFIDISELNPKTLKIICQSSTNPVFISIISANFKSYDQIAENIRFVDVEENHGFPADCLFCPFTGKLMKFPGRGIHCTHQQCFDIRSFLKIMNRYKHNICPICQKKIELTDLVVSKFALDTVRGNRNGPSSININTSQENQNSENNTDARMTGFTGDDFDISNEQIFPELGESFELNDMGLGNDY